MIGTSFDWTDAAFAWGNFVGDHEGLAASGTSFLAFLSQPHETSEVFETSEVSWGSDLPELCHWRQARSTTPRHRGP